MTQLAIATALLARGYALDTPAGFKGAVMAFQRDAGLTPDGLAGPKTEAALARPAPASPAGSAPIAAMSPIGRAALEAREGCRLDAYRDSVGIWTIGYGHTTAAGGLAVTPGLRITQEQADALFVADLPKYVDPVRKALSRPVPQEFFDACCSLAYNIGQVGFAHSSVVRRANAGDLAGAAEAFLMWNKPAEILSRRQGERDQALTPYAVALPRARRGDARPVKAPLARAA